MQLRCSRLRAGNPVQLRPTAIVCGVLLALAAGAAFSQEEEPPLPVLTRGGQPAGAPTAEAAAEETAAKLPPEQLDSLVAPIALYPDPLLAQTLVASTYPLELVQLQQWMAKNPDVTGDALAEAVAKQPWDPSIQSMAAVPDVVKRLVDDIQWTTDLGNAFLAQQDDVMDAVQRMRKKAQDKGALESNEQQIVETRVVEEKTVIVVESADPEVIYVPSYNPTVVYGAPYYPYPPIYYPYYPPGAAFVSFSFGFMWGAAWGGSCCGCGWGGNDIDINVDNNFNRNEINRGDRGGAGSGKWEHNAQHRGGTPYSDRATANKYGGSARGDSLANRQASARQQGGRQTAGAANRAGGAGVSNRAGGTGGRADTSGLAAHQFGGSASRSSYSGASTRSSGGDRVGNRSVPKSTGSRSSLSGGSRGYSGSSARMSSSRGASSMGGGMRGGGGGMRGGGGRR
ncbi:MAG TPA: DUF3300 domain-containing protein [Thermoanaerobaculales bacterium]|nr:DUF3300 domain-containing protein [Thermoanaerobaculales bacterium]HPA79461.1 DUF3300 domain-containing protein [Thermoanaerobaculales bacterium]HQL29473.1 DUF3300 domain-containing protein [Thermoanaerobaculales bacterium]HQN95118.1 DUF3300 domain-containing protein [Thermoanaerobaculales bacterium]